MNDLTEFELTVREVSIRDFETNEETTKWQVESENMETPCGGDTPEEALEVFVESLRSDDEEIAVNPEDLETEDNDELLA